MRRAEGRGLCSNFNILLGVCLLPETPATAYRLIPAIMPHLNILHLRVGTVWLRIVGLFSLVLDVLHKVLHGYSRTMGSTTSWESSSLSLSPGPRHSVGVDGLSVRWSLTACVRQGACLLKNAESVAGWLAGPRRIVQGLCNCNGTKSINSLHGPRLGVGLRFDKGRLQSMSLRELIIYAVRPWCQLCDTRFALSRWSLAPCILQVGLLILKVLLSGDVLSSGT